MGLDGLSCREGSICAPRVTFATPGRPDPIRKGGVRRQAQPSVPC